MSKLSAKTFSTHEKQIGIQIVKNWNLKKWFHTRWRSKKVLMKELIGCLDLFIRQFSLISNYKVVFE